ncbi:MAG: PDZ domain-containing protein [Verrucomicrobia bacterium]|jgi:serine protease Do|nr:PDZ domain-containing protein [Verrucomicrobiota bacterium]|tara:strand:+ start:54360 stop:55637 length:1278 start_codon:yes stop_codon:yes gene_type:complete
MKIRKRLQWLLLFAGLSMAAPGQGKDKNEVPLMRPAEEAEVNRQSDAFNKALQPVIAEAAKSTVRIWGNSRRPKILAYGTVVGDGGQVLTKWSEVERFTNSLQVQTDGKESYSVEIVGVFSEEDLVLLELGKGGKVLNAGEGFEESSAKLTPAKFHPSNLTLGKFLTAPQPTGKPVAFGVVSVLERNLRETDQAHLGIMADLEYKGEGVRISNVQPEYGAENAGLQAGDVILKVDDRNVAGLFELKNALAAKQPGDTVNILVESAGKERAFEVLLSNRPVTGQFSGDRLNQMERMGGKTSKVRSGFSKVVQSDMRIEHDRLGGPVVDLEGRIVGITLARADRTRTYIMGSEVVMDLLKGEYDTVAEARTKQTAREQMLAKQQRELIPKIRAMGKRPSLQRQRRHLSDMERLMERMNQEMEALEIP